MKASIKFREEEKPLFRAKVPLNILGFPFQSGISAGDAKELCLNLGTSFQSGPSLKIAYRPNDSWNPFSLIVKTGIGHFGSPFAAHMTMSAEFNLVGHGNPSFFLHFKPQIGDFSIRKSNRSPLPKIKSKAKEIDSDAEGSIENGVHGSTQNGVSQNGFSQEVNAVAIGGISNLFSDMAVHARTILPIRDVAVLKFRWGVRGSGAGFTESTLRNSPWKIPLLVMSKISVEQVVDEEEQQQKQKEKKNVMGDDDVAGACLAVKRQLEAMQVENSSLRRAIEEFRSDVRYGKSVFLGGNQDSGNYWENKRNGRKSPERRNDEGKSPEFVGPAGKAVIVDDNKSKS